MRGMRGVSGECEMCVFLARNGVEGEEGEWVRGLGLGVLDVCLG